MIPASAGKLLDQMGIPVKERTFAGLANRESYQTLAQSDFRLDLPKPIFPRLDASLDS